MKAKMDEFLKDIKSLLITGHIRPDGDCAGSCLALYTYVTRNFPEIGCDVMLERITDKLSFLSGFENVNTEYDTGKAYDLMICLDCATVERTGKAQDYFKTAAHTICIDHHISNEGYADENYIYPDSSSACEVLYDFLDREKLDRDMAICLYTGIVYDTGVFKYPATTPKTMRVAADLMEFGIPTNFIVDESFYAKTYAENRIFGYAVMKSALECGGRLIYSYITRKELKEFGVSGRELEGIVSQLRLTKGAWVSVFFNEISENKWKISFRSGDEADVNAIASAFGGGGHIRASGANMEGPLEECLEKIMKEASKQLCV